MSSLARRGLSTPEWSRNRASAPRRQRSASHRNVLARRRQSERETVAFAATDYNGPTGDCDALPLPDGTHPVVAISREHGTLYFAFPPFNSKRELFAASRDPFFTLSNISVVFSRDGTGRARSVVLAGQVTAARKP